MSLGRLFEILRAIACPILLGLVLICILLGLLAVMLTPEGLNPAEAVALRVYLLMNNNELNAPHGTDPTQERFVVEADDTAHSIGIRLVQSGLITNGSLFARYVRYEGMDTDLRAGTFFLKESMTIPEIARALTNPLPTTVRITVIEGWRMEQIADLIDQQPLLTFNGFDFLAVVSAGAALPLDFQQQFGIPAGASLEGFLFPATYEIPVDATALELRDEMLQAFRDNVTAQMLTDTLAQNRTMFEIVTLAAIVEREAVLAEERPQIAAVYLNRLEIGQKLDADPTTQYGLGNTRGGWWAQITQADYQLNHLYNTYVYPGLPPGPIANPSVSSIRAAIYPVESPYFYFRAACDGSGAHQFSVTFDEHLTKGC